MKIYTRVVMSLFDGKILEADAIEYSGPVAECKGGSTSTTSVDEVYNARMATIAESQQSMAEEYYQYYQDVYQPYETEQIAANRALLPYQVDAQKTAYGALGESLDGGKMADTAQGDMVQQFAGAQDATNRSLAKRGVRMDSGQAMQMQKQTALDRARAVGGARTGARQQAAQNAMQVIGGAQ